MTWVMLTECFKNLYFPDTRRAYTSSQLKSLNMRDFPKQIETVNPRHCNGSRRRLSSSWYSYMTNTRVITLYAQYSSFLSQTRTGPYIPNTCKTWKTTFLKSSMPWPNPSTNTKPTPSVKEINLRLSDKRHSICAKYKRELKVKLHSWWVRTPREGLHLLRSTFFFSKTEEEPRFELT